MNLSTGLISFILPFFMLRYLRLSRRQKISLVFVFSLGFLIIATSVARYAVFTIKGRGLDSAIGGTYCSLLFLAPHLYIAQNVC